MENKIKILIGGMLPPPNFGHTMIYQMLMNTEFSKNFSITFLNFRFWKYSRHKRVTVKKIGQFLIYYFYYIFLIIIKRPDYILYGISFDKMPFFKDSLFLMTGRILRSKIILHDQGQYLGDLYGTSPRFVRRYIEYTFRSVNAAIVLGEVAKNTYKNLLDTERVFVVPGAVKDTKGTGENRSKREKHNGLRILYFSFLTPAKGIWTAMEAASIVVGEQQGCQFIFAGPFDSGETEDNIKQFVRENSLDDQVQFVGYISDEECRTRLFRDADIFIFPTHRDVFGLVLLHAMAEGTPVIASNEGAISEILVGGKAGILIPKDDVTALANGIISLISNNDLRLELGQRGRERYEEMYTPENFGSRSIAAVNAIIDLDRKKITL